MQEIYFDNAATTPIDPEVISAMTDSMQHIFGNPSSLHQFGRKARSMLEISRKNIAKILNCSSGEIIFTSGGTEADNLILYNAVHHLGVKRIITSQTEHHAVLNTVQSLSKKHKTEIIYTDLDPEGNIDYQQLEEYLNKSDNKTLVSLMYVNNETGNILDIKKVSGLCEKYNALFHSDTVQSIAHLKLDLKNIPVDFIVASAHKFHGPKGVGFAYFRKGTEIEPLLTGGEQEKGARAGTENIHSIFGMAKALNTATENLEEYQKYLKDLKHYFIEQIKIIIPDIQFNALSDNPDRSVHHILNIRFPKEIPMILFNLDLKGIAVSGGSACQSGSNKGSHVLNRILDSEDARKSSVRFSFSKFNTKEEIDSVIRILKELVEK